MTLKVGERYKARNGQAVIICGANPFRGRGENWSDANPIVYKDDGSTLLPGWADWSIDGITPAKFEPTDGGCKQKLPDGSIRYWFFVEENDPRLAELAAKRLASFEETAEAMRMRHDKTVKAVRANSDLIAGNAAKIEELVDRMDAADRRAAALAESLYDAHDVIGKHENKLNSTRHGFASMQASDIAKRLEGLESRLTGVGGVHEAYKRIEETKCRLTELAARLKEEEKEGQTRDTILEQHGHRMTELLDRIRKLESQTYEQQKVINAFHGETPTNYNPTYGSSVANAAHSPKSMGWIVATPKLDGTISGLFWYRTREEACTRHSGACAIVEVFQGQRR